MKIEFRSKKLAKILQSESAIRKEYGILAKNLMVRLSELNAAQNLAGLPDCAHCHPLTGDKKGRFSVRIRKNWSLEFKPNLDKIPLLSDGGVDLEKIDSILVLEVVDHHGE